MWPWAMRIFVRPSVVPIPAELPPQESAVPTGATVPRMLTTVSVAARGKKYTLALPAWVSCAYSATCGVCPMAAAAWSPKYRVYASNSSLLPTTVRASFHQALRSCPVRLPEDCTTTLSTAVSPLPLVRENRKNLLWLTLSYVPSGSVAVVPGSRARQASSGLQPRTQESGLPGSASWFRRLVAAVEVLSSSRTTWTATPLRWAAPSLSARYWDWNR